MRALVFVICLLTAFISCICIVLSGAAGLDPKTTYFIVFVFIGSLAGALATANLRIKSSLTGERLD